LLLSVCRKEESLRLDSKKPLEWVRHNMTSMVTFHVKVQAILPTIGVLLCAFCFNLCDQFKHL